MPNRVASILKLDVPVIVVLGSRELRLRDVTALVPGAIVELPKGADEELELMVNNKVIATGRAVKVGENFGIRITFVGDMRARLRAMGSDAATESRTPPSPDSQSAPNAVETGSASPTEGPTPAEPAAAAA